MSKKRKLVISNDVPRKANKMDDDGQIEADLHLDSLESTKNTEYTTLSNWLTNIPPPETGVLIAVSDPDAAAHQSRFDFKGHLAKHRFGVVKDGTRQVFWFPCADDMIRTIYPISYLANYSGPELSHRLRILMQVLAKPQSLCYAQLHLEISYGNETARGCVVTPRFVNQSLESLLSHEPSLYSSVSTLVENMHKLADLGGILEPPNNLADVPIHPLEENGWKLPLWEWQSRNVGWMCSIENKRENQFALVRQQDQPVQIGKTSISISRSGISPIKQNHPLHHKEKMQVRGGLLCDNTGTGKSTSLLAFLMAQKHQQAGEKFDYYSSLPPDDSTPSQRQYYRSKATLVVCPKTIVNQWVDYCKRCIDRCVIVSSASDWKLVPKPVPQNMFVVLVIKTAAILGKLTLEQMACMTDLIIAPKDLFNSAPYRTLFNWPNDDERKKEYKAAVAAIRARPELNARQKDSEINKLKTKYHWVFNYSPSHFEKLRQMVMATKQTGKHPKHIHGDLLLEAFYFERLVIDEIHELGTKWTKTDQSVATLSADFVWGLTASPDFDTVAKQKEGGYHELLRISCPKLRMDQNPEALHAFVQNFTRSSGCLNFKINHRIVPVDFGGMEMSLYQSMSTQTTDVLLQFCSHHSMDSNGAPKTIQEACDDLKKSREIRLSDIEKELTLVVATLAATEKDKAALALDFGIRAAVKEEREKQLAKAKKTNSRRQTMLIKERENLVREQGYFDAVFKLMNDEQELECIICTENIPQQATALLPCGHYFDKHCLLQFWEGKSDMFRVCPYKCGSYKVGDIRLINRKAITKEQPSEANTNIYGSKIKRLVELIQEIIDQPDRGKILVYAEWDPLLIQISTALSEFGVKNTRIHGTVFAIGRQFESFKNDPTIRVLMLSADSNLSGSDLPHASDIIFTHPLSMGPSASVAAYHQAVGRLTRIGQSREIRVHHMITRQTIEPEIYEDIAKQARMQIGAGKASLEGMPDLPSDF